MVETVASRRRTREKDGYVDAVRERRIHEISILRLCHRDGRTILLVGYGLTQPLPQALYISIIKREEKWLNSRRNGKSQSWLAPGRGSAMRWFIGSPRAGMMVAAVLRRGGHFESTPEPDRPRNDDRRAAGIFDLCVAPAAARSPIVSRWKPRDDRVA